MGNALRCMQGAVQVKLEEPGTVVLLVPCATVPRLFGVEAATGDRAKDIEMALNMGLAVGSNTMETRIPDMRAVPAALALRRAFEEAGFLVLLLVNEVTMVDADEKLQYVGSLAFKERALATLRTVARTRRLALVAEVHSFSVRGRHGEAPDERPPTNWYAITPSGHEMGMPHCIERGATPEHVLLQAGAEWAPASYILLEFFQFIYQYPPESLQRDAARIAQWARNSGR